MRIGLISDTHGLLRPEAIEALNGSDLILHTGDIGDPEILERLRLLAPLEVVRGNTDYPTDWPEIAGSKYLELEGLSILMVHDKAHAPVYLAKRPANLVIFGHSHQPADFVWEGVRYINPGAAGKKRFSLPISVAFLVIEAGNASLEFVNLLDERELP